MKTWLLFLAVFFAISCSASRDEQVLQMRHLQNNSRTSETLYPLWDLVRAFPDDLEIQSLYGRALLDGDISSHAIWPLRKVAEDPEASIQDHLRLAIAYKASGASEAAFAVAQEIIEVERDHVDGLMLNIRLGGELSRWEELLDSTSRLIDVSPAQMPTAFVWKARALAGLKRFPEAYEVLESAKETFSQYSNSTDLMANLCLESAAIASQQGNFGDEDLGAVEAAIRAADPDQVHDTPSDPEGDDAAVQLVREKWETCLETFPGNLTIAEGATRFFDAQEDREKSESILRRLISLRPYELSARSNLAEHLAWELRFDEAEDVLREATELERIQSSAWFAFAHYFREREDFDAAVEAFENAVASLEEGDWSSLSSFQLAQYTDDCIQSGQLDKAKQTISAIDRPEYAALLRGRISLLEKNPEKAIEELHSGLRLYQGNPSARYLLGQAAEQLGDLDRAIQEYRDSFRSGVTNSDAAYALVRLYEAEGNAPAIFHILNVRLSRDQHDPRINQEIARVATETGAVEMAQAAIDRLTALPGQQAAAALATARLERRTNGSEAAIEALEQMQLDLTQPELEEALFALVRNLIGLKRYDEAMSQVEASLDSHPDFSPFHHLHALVLWKYERGSKAKVRGTLEKALELDPENMKALRSLAEWNADNENIDEAIEIYDRVTASDPEDPQLSSWAAINLLLQAERRDEVDERLEALLLLDPTHSGAAALLARRLLQASRESNSDSQLQRAESLAKQALRFRGDINALEVAGLIALELKQNVRAVRLLRKTAQLRPNSPSVRYWLGTALRAAGHPEEARESLEIALSGEDFPEADAAREVLARLEAGESSDE